MQSLFDPSANAEIKRRIGQLNNDSPALWGKMNVNQMLGHCAVGIKTSLGDAIIPRVWVGYLFGRLAKRSVLKPESVMGKNLPTDKTFVIRDPETFEQEKAKLLHQVDRFLEVGKKGITKHPHPFFGKMTAEEWDRLQWKHMDHHLKQFGV